MSRRLGVDDLERFGAAIVQIGVMRFRHKKRVPEDSGFVEWTEYMVYWNLMRFAAKDESIFG
jgi:hypothetical protein